MSADGARGPGAGRGGEGRAALAASVAGAALGTALALAGLLGGPRAPELAGDGDAVAWVGDRPIPRADYETALALLAADRRGGLEPGDAERVLERLVDEALLLERALELGLAYRDRSVRNALVAAMLEHVLAQADCPEPGESEARRFFEANAGYFARPARVAVEVARFRADGGRFEEARRRAEAARVAAIADARSLGDLGDPLPVPPPDRPLDEATLARYVGPRLASAAFEAPEGAIVGPVPANGSLWLLRVRAREGPVEPAYEELRELARAEMRRRCEERALRAYLEELRARTRIVRRPDALATAGGAPARGTGSPPVP